MAIARGAGTEIIRSAYFEDVDATDQILIFGTQHHIYTVISMFAFCDTLQAAFNQFLMYFVGYDSKAGTSAQVHKLLQWEPAGVNSTFVWNDKFTFNGHEPTDFLGPMDDATKQDAIADQGSSVAQYIYAATENAADQFELSITYLDQNNA